MIGKKKRQIRHTSKGHSPENLLNSASNQQSQLVAIVELPRTIGTRDFHNVPLPSGPCITELRGMHDALEAHPRVSRQLGQLESVGET